MLYWYPCATKANEDIKKIHERQKSEQQRIAVNTKELQAMLGCGRKTAVDIGEQAGAKIQIGRRVLWNPIVVKEYIAQISL